MMKNFNLHCIAICLTITNLLAQEKGANNQLNKFYIKPYGGFIGIQDMTIQLLEDNVTSDLSVENGFGFTTGISLGYNLTKKVSTEIGWEYKSNDVTIVENNVKSSGDYASNFIYLNSFYNFATKGMLKPYLGFGISLIQEIDLDLEEGNNRSFSNSGNIGFQFLAGLDFNFTKKWALNWEAKYVYFQDFDMQSESNTSSLNNLSYNPFIFNIGIKYRI